MEEASPGRGEERLPTDPRGLQLLLLASPDGVEESLSLLLLAGLTLPLESIRGRFGGIKAEG